MHWPSRTGKPWWRRDLPLLWRQACDGPIVGPTRNPRILSTSSDTQSTTILRSLYGIGRAAFAAARSRGHLRYSEVQGPRPFRGAGPTPNGNVICEEGVRCLRNVLNQLGCRVWTGEIRCSAPAGVTWLGECCWGFVKWGGTLRCVFLRDEPGATDLVLRGKVRRRFDRPGATVWRTRKDSAGASGSALPLSRSGKWH